MNRTYRGIAFAFLLAALSLPAAAEPKQDKSGRKHRDPAAVQRLQAEAGGAADVSVSAATGAARFVKLNPGRHLGQERRAASLDEKKNTAIGFLTSHGNVFGLSAPEAELTLQRIDSDAAGTHLTYAQHYRGVPVFGAVLKAHFDRNDELAVVNGSTVPGVAVDPTPSRSAESAGRNAVTLVTAASGADDVSVRSTRLVVFREGLAKGVEGDTHLAWEVEVGNGNDVREFVYMDAHTGKFVDQITGIEDALFRRAYDAEGATAPGPNYPGSPFWEEGEPFPTSSTEADNMILASGETYNLFSNAFGRDSFDAAGAVMIPIFNRGNGCPNASWNGTFISFCPGVTTDDVTAHEWGHAYTQYTHNLIYAWQSGALNESYSDIWGEVVDFINGRGSDSPGGPRSADACTTFSPPRGQLVVNSPASIAGAYAAQSASFGPALTPAGVTGDVVLGLDDANASGPSTTDACTALTNAAAVAGKVALVDRGTCTFVTKVLNAQNAGAIAVIVANNVSTGLPGMGGASAAVTISSLGVTQGAGNLIKTNLPGVNATLRGGPGSDNTYRWLVGEDATAFGGAIRDLWNPNCYSDPGRVVDAAFYTCATGDAGGVHTNSGVPNHGFALLVDGGTYNGQTVGGIGLTKGAHIYFRAQSVYQGPASDFADHADSLEQSCADLVGAPLADLSTGAPSGQVITAADCAQVASMAAAVELRTPPTFCNFQPMLAKNPPAFCGADSTRVDVFADNFESAPAAWTATHLAVTPADFTDRDWIWVTGLPDREGNALFAPDPDIGTCAPGGDESGVLHLDSPAITLPGGVTNPLLTFDHWMATEPGFDGGNVRVSVNGGPYTLVANADFTYNAYNMTLVTAGGGNTNPMAGQRAFSGTDGGSVQGSWGRSMVNLTNYADAGDTVRLRFDLGSDGCAGNVGWILDDLAVYACTSNTLPTVNVADVSIVEGNSGFTPGAFTVSLSHAFAQPVSVRYRLLDGTAKRGRDYVPFDGLGDRTLSIPALSISAEIPLRIRGEREVEANETFFVTLGDPVNATLGDAAGVCTIVNDDPTP